MVSSGPLSIILGLILSLSLVLAGCLGNGGEGGDDAGGTTNGDQAGVEGDTGSGTGAGDLDPFGEDTSRTLAPDFSVIDVTGTRFTLAEQRGSKVLVYLMSPDCSACAYFHPQMVEFLADPATTDLVTIAIGVWGSDTEEKMVAYSEREDVTYLVALDTDGVGGKFTIRATPTYFLIDEYGRIALSFGGTSAAEMLAAYASV